MNIFLRKIKNIFIPTEENGHVPWVLGKRASYIFIALAFSFIVPAMYFQATYLASLLGPAPFEDNEVVHLINQSRGNSGLSSLSVSEELNSAAESKLRHMIQNGYFAHFAPDGTSPWNFIRGAGYNYSAAGENLAVDFASAYSVHNALMNSATHRANIMSPLYSEVGIAVARGNYQGRNAVYVVQMFGNPAFGSPSIVQASPATPEEREDIITEPEEEVILENEPVEVDVAGESDIEEEEPGTEQDEVVDLDQEIFEEDNYEEDEVVEEVENIENDEEDTNTILALPPIDMDLLLSVGAAIETYARSVTTRLITALFIVLSIMTGIAFLISRRAPLRPEVLARSFVVMVIFSFMVFQPYYEVLASKITPVAMEDMVYEVILSNNNN